MKKIKTNYKLIDCGDGEKLEQFANILIRRPAPQAIWKKKLNEKIWENFTAQYKESTNKWILLENKTLPDFELQELRFKLKYSPKRQLGVFPEQLVNWQWLKEFLAKENKSLNIFNGFAYTGIASIVAATSANNIHQITHLDAAAASVKWAKENYAINSSENNIRWITDDILSFLKREIKRGKKYDGFILDPPAFGRAKKNTWKIDRDLPRLLDYINHLISDNPKFIILSSHDKNFSASRLSKLIKSHLNLPAGKLIESNLIIPSEKGNKLPAGESIRWEKL